MSAVSLNKNSNKNLFIIYMYVLINLWYSKQFLTSNLHDKHRISKGIIKTSKFTLSANYVCYSKLIIFLILIK